MKVICAGLSKTGTKSIASALRILGYNVHDIEEHWRYHLDEYTQAFEGRMPDFSKMYANVDAVIASPSYLFWQEIFAAFPNQKVLLMVRDNEDVWLESAKTSLTKVWSIRSSLWMRLGYFFTPTGRKWKRYDSGLSRKFGLKPNSPIQGYFYSKHNAHVMSCVPESQLLVYNVKQGWQPLCEFLGVEVPDMPFPRLNENSSYIDAMFYNSHIYKKMAKELVIILAFTVLITAIIVYYICSKVL